MNVGDLYIGGEITDKFFHLLSFYDMINLKSVAKSHFNGIKIL